jgi:TorA maturation chaperone TorD
MDQSSMMAGRVIADVEREYIAAGLSAPVGGVSADHVAVEMEFVSFLRALETHCWESEDRVGALEYIERERAFQEDHRCRWLASLDRGVAAREGPELYTDAARAARALTAHDADFLATLGSSLGTRARAGYGGPA